MAPHMTQTERHFKVTGNQGNDSDSDCKILAVKAWGVEFGSLALLEKAGSCGKK